MKVAAPREGFRLAGYNVKPQLGKIEGQSDIRRLEPRVMDLLVYLAERQGQVVERDAIINDVWRGAIVSDEVISRSIYLIRKALSDGGIQREALIETIPKRGYRLLCKVRPLDPEPVTGPVAVASPGPAVAAAAAIASTDPEPAASAPLNRPVRAPGTVRWLALAGVLVVAAAAAGFSILSVHRANTGSTPPATVDLPVDRPKSLVVLPLTETGDAPDTAFLSSGLSDEIAGGLASIAELRVVAMSSAIRARAAHESYAAIGRELNVATILDGRLEARSGAVTLKIRLVDAASGEAFSERTYVGTLAASTALKQVVIVNVAAALGVTSASLLPPPAVHEPAPDAYRLYLQGRHYAHLNTAGGFRQAHDYYQQAVQADPQFAEAWAALGTSSVLMIDFGNRPRDEAVREAQPAARRAAELQPDLPEAQAALGLIALYGHRFEESADALRRATSLRPSYSQAHMWLGRLYYLQGDVGRAAAAYQRAYDLDPKAPIVDLNLGMALDMQGRYPQAVRILEQGIGNAPDFANLYWAKGHVEWERGDFAAAAIAYRKAIELGADYVGVHAQYSMLLADMGDNNSALAELSRAEAMDGAHAAVWEARVHLAAASGRFAQFQDRAAAGSAQDESSEFWRALAAAKIELLRGDARAARAIYERAQIEQKVDRPEFYVTFDTLGGPAALLDLACAYQMTGEAHHAEQLIERAESAVAQRRARGINVNDYDYLLAAAAAMRGDQSRAAALLRSARTQGWRDVNGFKRDPRFGRIRNQLIAFIDIGGDGGTAATTVRQ